MMIRITRFPVILLACFSVSLLNAVTINTVHATQKNTGEVQNKQETISGKVTDIITAGGLTYAEIDTAKEKVWAAAPAAAILNKGDSVAFSTEMPMYNFYSKALQRDFSVVYFIKQYITGKQASTITPDNQVKTQQDSNQIPTASAASSGEVKIGAYLRETTLDGLNGKNKKFSDYKGSPLIINIWASWCGPCRAEMGSLERLAQRYSGKEFNIIGISTDDYRNKAEAFIRQTGITFENFLDHRLLLENMLGANTIPLTVLVDEQGRVLQKVRGSREWDNPEIIDAIAQVFRIKL